MRSWSTKALLALMVMVGATAGLAVPAGASHSWGSYHWARTSNPFTLALGDNVTSTWDPYLAKASADWTASSVLDTTVVPGVVSPKQCSPTSGQVQVCNAAYGRNGWLGIASIWTSGGHIVQGTVKLNDSYFNLATYNTPGWRQFVACQEIGHTFGLDHQDENFKNANLGTCMDYTNYPDGGGTGGALANLAPNAHDYAQLETIYSHVDATSTVRATTASSPARAAGDTPGAWGRLVAGSTDPHSVAVFDRDYGHDEHVFTFVVWAD